MYCHELGVSDAISFDMGGTTAKICIIKNGIPSISHEFEAARIARFKRGSGYPIQLPVIELIEIGAGGGSIAHVDSLGLLKVGPEGSGSDPGPVCYGLGGEQPTVTDADLLLGYLNPHYFLGGKMVLNTAHARQVLSGKIARPLNTDDITAAWGVHDVVNENMASACRIHAVERGFDPRSFMLIAFGGAGPVHAQAVARKLGIDKLVIPPAAGIASALGLLGAVQIVNLIQSSVQRFDKMDVDKLSSVFEVMETRSKTPGLREYSVERQLDMRFVGQGHQVTVSLPQESQLPSMATIRELFFRDYARLFGRVPENVPLEVVNFRSVLKGPPPLVNVPKVSSRASGTNYVKGQRRAYFAEPDGFVDCYVYDRYSLPDGLSFEGPAIVEEVESTTVIGPGQYCRVKDGMLVIAVR
jgi:N-methylhydantoinase A